jgi:hypothetical protein
MRVADRPTPPVLLHRDAGLEAMPLRPVVAIAGRRVVAEWDDPALLWDADADPGGATARVGSARVGRARVGRA